MGCIYFNSRNRGNSDSKELIPEKKEYSWDKRPKLNRKDYTIENVVSNSVIRVAGTVDGRQFIIENCKDAVIYVLDHCNTVTIDDCVDCKIILGPTKGSVFVRGCENCVIVALCGQFRARDCRKLMLYLCCSSQPSIESCCKVRVGCCLINYKNLKEQMLQAAICPFNNQWNMVYDFTPVSSEGSNWRTTAPNLASLFVPGDVTSDTNLLRELEFCLGDVSKSMVPLTTGNNRCLNHENCCLVIILPGQDQSSHAYDFLSAMTNMDGRFELVETQKRLLAISEACELLHQVFPPSKAVFADKASVVGLHFKGTGCLAKCQQVATRMSLSPECCGQVFSSPSSEVATRQIHQFFNLSVS